jgi:predicted tellurium resistance membrane protein TerC
VEFRKQDSTPFADRVSFSLAVCGYPAAATTRRACSAGVDIIARPEIDRQPGSTVRLRAVDWISNPEIWSALATLTLLELVLGVDNVVFISILAAKLPESQQDRARKVGLLAAAGLRAVLLMVVGVIVSLKDDLFELFGVGFSSKDLILVAGGGFLLYKATKEIHYRLEGVEGHGAKGEVTTFGAVIGQVLVLDLVFSIDSVITAVGMTDYVAVMVAAVTISVAVMLFASKPIYEFVNQHPTVKMLALSFLLLIGMMLVAEGLGQKIPKGYMYAAIAFSVLVEMLNIRSRKRSEPVTLHEPFLERQAKADVHHPTVAASPVGDGR